MSSRLVCSSFAEAVEDIPEGASIAIGGFAKAGQPSQLILALLVKGTSGLTIICNGCSGFWNSYTDASVLIAAGQVAKLIASFPVPGSGKETILDSMADKGEVDVEIVPQGTLAERLRIGGAGLGPFYTPTGAGTEFAKGKQSLVYDGREHILEMPLRPDFAFIRAHKADSLGNLVYRRAQRNFNPVMAMAAKVSIAEVDEIVPAGSLDPEAIVTPAAFIQRLTVRSAGER